MADYAKNDYFDFVADSELELALIEHKDDIAKLMMILGGFLPDKDGGFKNPIRSRRLCAQIRCKLDESPSDN